MNNKHEVTLIQLKKMKQMAAMNNNWREVERINKILRLRGSQ